MTDDLDAYLAKMQQDIDDDVRKYYGDAFFHRWRTPPNTGELDGAACGEQTGSCGDTMRIFLRFDGGRVAEATFWTDGCASSTVSASWAAELAMGKTEEELMEITGETVLAAVGVLPDDDTHCAFLAANALQAALEGHRSGS